jgi:hypothetical protein
MEVLISSINKITTGTARRSSRQSIDPSHVRLSRRTEYVSDDLNPEMVGLKPRQLEQWDMYVIGGRGRKERAEGEEEGGGRRCKRGEGVARAIISENGMCFR